MTDAFAPLLTMNDDRSIPQVGLGVYKVAADETAALVHGAIAAGYRHIDTAALYENEEGVGEGVRASGVPREQLFVTSKVWNDRHGIDETRRAFHESLAKTGLDYLDLFLIHWPAPTQNRYVEAWRALIALREKGVVRSIGVSNFEPSHLRRIVDSTGVAPAVNQVELHPHRPQHAVRAATAAHGVLTESWSPLARGRVLDAGSHDRAVLDVIGEKYGRTAAQVALRWHVQQGLVIIPKSASIARVRANTDVVDWMLDADDMVAIASLETGERTGLHPDDHG